MSIGKNDFRMTRNIFVEIVTIIQPVMEKRDIQLRRAITKEKALKLLYGSYQPEIHSVQQQRHLPLQNQQQCKLLLMFALKLRD